MSNASIEIGGIHIGIQSDNKEETPATVPFHALILANLSGSDTSTVQLKPKTIDRDNFDDRLLSISPTLSLCPTGDESNSLTLTFKELEDFEPDHLYETLDIFAELRTLRRRLANNETFEAAAQEMKSWHQPKKAEPQKQATPLPEPPYQITNSQATNREMTDNKSLLDTLLSETTLRQKEEEDNAGSNLAQTLIQQVVAPYIIAGTHQKKAETLSTIDDAISGLMNSILHDPQFQSLESSWRCLYSSVRKIKTNNKLKLYYYDTNKNKLSDDSSEQNIANSGLYKKIIEPYADIAGGISWSVIIADYFFGDTLQDVLLLEKMGVIAQHCNATFVSAAKPELIGCSKISEEPTVDDWNQTREEKYITAWDILRQAPQAKNIALTFPRTLVRLPYGEKTKSIEAFSFEEMKNSEHDRYLWGNSAYSVLVLLAESFELNNWQFSPGQNNEINNLPAHSFIEDGDSELKPCAEIYLTEKGAERLLTHGLLPIWSILRSDSIRVGPFSSLHCSNSRILGKWLN